MLVVDTVIGLDGNLRMELRLELAVVAESNPEVLKGRVRYELPPAGQPGSSFAPCFDRT